MAISRDFIDELLARTDITELISGYVDLKRSGSNTKGLCPFHNEKTPSFSVNSDMQIFKCFGCGKGGNAITFIMDIENLPFIEAVEILAKRAGMEIPEESKNEGDVERTSRRKRITELNRDAAMFFYKMLSAPQGQAARDYLASRNITKETATRFGIGAAPDDWSALYHTMQDKGYTKQELLDAGLVRQGQKPGSIHDFFRNRVMFPVIDIRGDVVAFSGRALDPDAKGFKYLNSPDTIVFSKSRTLFGLNLAKKSKAGRIILVEGNFDVVMLHQAGFDNAVAQLGSAFTPAHARLLAQYTNNIILAFDGDEAGRKATDKAIPIIEATGKNVTVIDLGDKDPDDYIKTYGADAFRNLTEHGKNQTQYKLQTILGRHNINTDEGKLTYLSEATQYLADIESIPEREIYTEQVAKIIGISIDGIKNEIKRIQNKKQAQKRAKEKKSPQRLRETVQPASRDLKYKNTASAVAEEGVIRCLIKDGSLMRLVEEMNFTAEEFTAPFLAKIYTAAQTRLTDDTDIAPALIMSELESAEASHLAAILDKPESISAGEVALRQYINKIRAEKLKQSDPDGDTLLEIAKLKRGE